MSPSQKPERPATPSLDAARAEALALQQYDQQVAEFEKRQREAAEAAARTARRESMRKRHAGCAVAAQDAAKNLAALVASLDAYVAASELPPYQVNTRVQSFLAKSLRKYGPIEIKSIGLSDELMHELFPEVAA